jgi:hypothetical protein
MTAMDDGAAPERNKWTAMTAAAKPSPIITTSFKLAIIFFETSLLSLQYSYAHHLVAHISTISKGKIICIPRFMLAYLPHLYYPQMHLPKNQTL